jgi:hypothetical protein
VNPAAEAFLEVSGEQIVAFFFHGRNMPFPGGQGKSNPSPPTGGDSRFPDNFRPNCNSLNDWYNLPGF